MVWKAVKRCHLACQKTGKHSEPPLFGLRGYWFVSFPFLIPLCNQLSISSLDLLVVACFWIIASLSSWVIAYLSFNYHYSCCLWSLLHWLSYLLDLCTCFNLRLILSFRVYLVLLNHFDHTSIGLVCIVRICGVILVVTEH